MREKTIRLQCLAAAVALAAAALVFDLALAWRVVLGIVALLELPLALGPGRAVHVQRTDGRAWTIPFCRTHEFDASLALEDARRRRNALEADQREGLRLRFGYRVPRPAGRH